MKTRSSQHTLKVVSHPLRNDRPPGGSAHEPGSPPLQRRLRKFMALVPDVLSGEDAEAVHDLRVWSRRLQQNIDALFPKPRPPIVQAVRRTLRRARRAVGDWRNADVVLDLIARRRKRSRHSARQSAWALVEERLRSRRTKLITRARRRLLRLELAELPAELHKLLSPTAQGPGTSVTAVRAAIGTAWSQWRDVLVNSRESPDAATLHAFRIATKRLRYRVELAIDLGVAEIRPVLNWLKDLQEILGQWHDRQILAEMTTQALAKPRILREHLEAVRLVLADLERERQRGGSTVDEILRPSTEDPARRHLEQWLGT